MPTPHESELRFRSGDTITTGVMAPAEIGNMTIG
jgi:hypothetical protein